MACRLTQGFFAWEEKQKQKNERLTGCYNMGHTWCVVGENVFLQDVEWFEGS